MKRYLSIVLAILLIATIVVACQPKAAETPATPATPAEASPEAPAATTEPAETAKWEDGKYFAAADVFAENGWKETVELEVKDGKIAKAVWNAVSNKLGIDKLTAIKQGKYPMVAAGKAQSEWDVQAKATEEYLLQTQDPTKIEYKDNEGHTDAISGVSIHVNGFFDLAQKALAAGVAQPGPYKDGVYHAEADEFADSGWKGFVDVTVMNGNIVAAKWNAINKDDPKLDKMTAVAEGKYPMVAAGKAQAEWDVQAKAVEDYLLEKQDFTSIQYSDAEGHTDAIAGVSIHVSEFFELVKKALGM